MSTGVLSEVFPILEKIRDQYYDIQMLTMHCCSDISADAIPDMICQRAELMNQIASEERFLKSGAAEDENDPALRRIRGEIATIMRTIVTLDKQLEQIIEGHLRRMRREIAVLSKSSKAISAYTVQSRV